MILFGISLTSMGAYSLVQGKNKVNGIDITIKPVLQVTKIDESTLTVVVNHNQPIKYLEYYWNDEEPEKININAKNNIQQTIEILPGNNTLYILVEDVSGNQGRYEKEYSYAIEGDIEKPKISMQVIGNYVEIDAKDETEIDYMTYGWNDEEPEIVRPSVERSKVVSTRVEVKKGENVLKVEAFDKEGNSWSEEKKYKGVTRPTVDVVRDGDKLLLTVDDVEGIQYIDVDLNEQRYRIQLPETLKQIKYSFDMEEGTNIVKVVAYSINGESTTFDGEAIK